MLDATNHEKQVFAAVAVVTEPFAQTAAVLAELNGMPGSLEAGEMHGASLAFSAPFAVAAMTDAAHQQWLDALWNFTVVQDADVDQGDDYYGNTIKVIDMIIMSGNYWLP